MPGQKLYKQSADGGLSFSSQRRAGEVRIPNYVYDLWTPIVGAEALGVYSVYCRLEREGCVKAMTMNDIARACRIGHDSLSRINALLAECGFVTVTKPAGEKRLMHWTTRVEIMDPPSSVSAALIEKYQTETGYKPLSTWLVEPPACLPGPSGEANRAVEDGLTGPSNIESLDLATLEDCTDSAKTAESGGLVEKPVEKHGGSDDWVGPPASTTQAIQSKYEALLGYKLGKAWAGEGAAAKRIAQRYTPDQLAAAYAHYKAQPFWEDKRVSLRYLATNMPEFFRDGQPAPAQPAGEPFIVEGPPGTSWLLGY